MQVYVGYGFNVNEVPAKDWLKLMREHDPEEYEAFVASIKEECGEEDLEANLLDNVEDEIAAISSLAEYLRDIINDGESEKAGTDYIVSSCDNFLMFESLRFSGDEARAKHIRSESAFAKMIARYIPIKNLTFGNIYEGSEWVDTNCYMDAD